MRGLPGSYVLNKFFTYAGDPAYRKTEGNYNASCNICREGKSWLKKKRLYFYPSTNSFYCFNCNKSWNALSWIQESTGLTREEIELEVHNSELTVDISRKINSSKNSFKEKPSLPYDSINLFDKQQENFYKFNSCFEKVQEYVFQRRLNSAVNKSPNYYISLTDHIHKNRLCIPYYDRSNKINFYQTRSVDGSEPRYLNKIGYEKTIFGIDRIDVNLDYIFIFEGPIDAMFVKNGVCLAGLNLTEIQQKQLSEFPFHQKIWVLDNPNKDEAAKEKIYSLISRKEKVFRWQINSPFKDFNEWAIKEGRDEIFTEEILNSLYTV